jgi:hypothetical protein
MIDKIILLDSNPYKKNKNDEWYRELKEGKGLFAIQDQLLRGLEEIRGSISMYDKENTYTTTSVVSEIEKFHEIIEKKYDLFLNIQKKYYGKATGRAKKNKDLFKILIGEIYNLEETMRHAIYEPEQHKGCSVFYQIARMKSEEVAQIKGKKYSEADTMLATIPLVRAYHDLETEVQTPDNDIHLIINKSTKHFLNTDILDIHNFALFEEKIKVWNTSKKKLEKKLF